MKNNLSRQEQEVLAILKASPMRRKNSYDADWRDRFRQLPARIYGLRAKGYVIPSKHQANGSVDYILLSEPKVAPAAPQTALRPKFAPAPHLDNDPEAIAWEFLADGTARVRVGTQKDVTEPRQGSLF